jgi:hypothetical protein
MKTKISKAQLEVWEWKEKLSEELKHLPVEEWMKYLRKKTANTFRKTHKKPKKAA